MPFEFKISASAPTPLPPPAWCADLAIELVPSEGEIKPDESIEVEAISIQGKLGEFVVWPQAWMALYPWNVPKAGGSVMARVPMSPEIIRCIEKKRAGNGPVRLAVTVLLRFRRIRSEGPAYNAPTIAGKSETVTSTVRWDIHRDPWRECLKNLGWNEIEIFELPTGPTWDDPQLRGAVDALHSAEHLLHFGGDPKVVLAKCYDALDSAAKYAIQGDDKKKGFEALLSRAFPGDADKAQEVDRMISGLNALTHFGRHGEYPTRHVSWTEARFGLVTTLAVFELLANNGR